MFAGDDGLNLLGDRHLVYGWDTFYSLNFLSCSVSVCHWVRRVSAAYALLLSKHQDIYEESLTAILDVCLRKDIQPNNSHMVVEYEIAIHNAARSAISLNIDIQGCFYHLTQATWRRIQSEGLQAAYKSDQDVRNFSGMLDSLAFLPVDRVSDGMQYQQDVVPDNLRCLAEYFDSTNVSRQYRAVVGAGGTMRFRCTAPRFSPQTWNVHEATLSNQHRTNNMCRSWNNGFEQLAHPFGQ